MATTVYVGCKIDLLKQGCVNMKMLKHGSENAAC